MEKIKLFSELMLALIILAGCAPVQNQLTVSQFRFDYNGESYRIRSINAESQNDLRNEIIGGRFMAVDFDKDKIVDSIILGDVDLSVAQRVYDFGLEKLSKENKLVQQQVRNGRFVFAHDELFVEIKTFNVENKEPFNEFKIQKKRTWNPNVFAFQDVNADGLLDTVLKGECSIHDYQGMYSEAIESGLETGQLIRRNGLIVVKGY